MSEGDHCCTLKYGERSQRPSKPERTAVSYSSGTDARWTYWGSRAQASPWYKSTRARSRGVRNRLFTSRTSAWEGSRTTCAKLRSTGRASSSSFARVASAELTRQRRGSYEAEHSPAACVWSVFSVSLSVFVSLTLSHSPIRSYTLIHSRTHPRTHSHTPLFT